MRREPFFYFVNTFSTSNESRYSIRTYLQGQMGTFKSEQTQRAVNFLCEIHIMKYIPVGTAINETWDLGNSETWHSDCGLSGLFAQRRWAHLKIHLDITIKTSTRERKREKVKLDKKITPDTLCLAKVVPCQYDTAELGIFCVIFAFCGTIVSQNAKITRKNFKLWHWRVFTHI